MKKLLTAPVRLLGAVALSLTAASAYIKISQGRSLLSWLVEKVLWWARRKNADISTPAALDEFFERRRLDETPPAPSPTPFIGRAVARQETAGMPVYVWNSQTRHNQRVILFLHGGFYAYSPLIWHYLAADNISRQAEARTVFPIIPKLPQDNIDTVFPKIVALYKELLEYVHDSSQISIIGDSAGSTLALGLADYLAENKLPQPKDLILMSPWVDSTLSNPDLENFDDYDPILSIFALQRFGREWAASRFNLEDPRVSPIFSKNFKQMGRISIFAGTHEIFYPEAVRLHEKLVEEGVVHTFVVGEKMNHVYPIYLVPEGRAALRQIVDIIRTPLPHGQASQGQV